jgi:hypothetical protein
MEDWCRESHRVDADELTSAAPTATSPSPRLESKPPTLAGLE